MPEIVEMRIDADLLDFYTSNRSLNTISHTTDIFSNSIGIEALNSHLPLKIIRFDRERRRFLYF